MACLQIHGELLSVTTFLRVHSNSEEVSYLFWQKTYANLKTTCRIKLKIFLWTKLLENLLLAKYLISVAAPLTFSWIELKVLLTCKDRHNETFFILPIFASMSSPSPIYVVSMWSTFYFHLHFHYDHHKFGSKKDTKIFIYIMV